VEIMSVSKKVKEMVDKDKPKCPVCGSTNLYIAGTEEVGEWERQGDIWVKKYLLKACCLNCVNKEYLEKII